MKKTPWQQPSLVVMARSKAEEAVLAACKEDALLGPKLANQGCLYPPKAGKEKTKPCAACDLFVVS